jgi:UDP-N-acetylglucosamine transferase subunit ALG13
MILVTVGTTAPFDELLMEVDRLAGAGLFDEPILCQSGQSTYRVVHGEQFMARPSIADLISSASLVISHGGATVVQLLLAGKNFVAFPNPRMAGDHQTSFLKEIAEVANISWSKDVADLAKLYADRRRSGPPALRTDIPRAVAIIRGMLVSRPGNI